MRTKKIAFVSTAVLAAISAVGLLYFELLVREVQERFNEIQPDIVRRAYANMLFKGLAGKYGNIDGYTTEQLDELFLQEVALASLK